MPAAAPTDVPTAPRILVYGVTGSGKSTLSRQLADRLGRPHIPTDDLGWAAGWQKRDPEEADADMRARTAAPAWVADSFWGSQRTELLPRVDLVVGLDLPPALTWWRLVRRTIRRVVTREPVCNGNVETLGRMLGRDSILHWHRSSWRSKRDRLRAWESAPEGPPVLRLTTPAQVRGLLASLPARTSAEG